MNKLEFLLHEYQRQLYADAGIEVNTRIVIEPNVVLMAVEKMLGVEGGGHNLGDALVQWLSLPSQNRVPVEFVGLKAKWDAQE